MKHWNFRKAVVAREDMPAEHRLKQSLSWPHLVALGVGAIVGTGILTLIGVGAGKAGPAVILSFAIAGASYIHRGIANRAFERRFGLADHIKVTGADMKDGLLSIELTREIPEAMKPSKIDIGGGEHHTINAQPNNDEKPTTQRVAKQTENV